VSKPSAWLRREILILAPTGNPWRDKGNSQSVIFGERPCLTNFIFLTNDTKTISCM